MRRSCTMPRAGLVFLVFLASGCGADPFAPPPRVSSSATNAEAEATKAIYMIFPSAPTGELEVWGLIAQREANEHRVVFRLMGPPPAQPGMSQADVIPRAIVDGASALVVVPGDSPKLAEALADAEAKKIPVVLLGRSIPSPKGSPPFTYVDHEPFEASAKRIVSTTLEDAKKAGRPPQGTALLLTDTLTDPTSAERVAALKAAAEASGLRLVTISYDGAEPGSAKAATLGAIKANPDTLIVLADEGEGLVGASQARIALGGNPAVFVGGYAGYRNSLSTVVLERESCFAEGRVGELARLAVLTALKKLDGESTGERVSQGAVFHRGMGQVAEPVKPTGSNVGVDSFNKLIDDGMPRPSIPRPPVEKP